jgi:hypothetical protein
VDLEEWTAAEAAALDGLLTAAATLLDRLRAARDPAERAALGAAFDAAARAVRERLVRDDALDAGEADRIMARALAAVATLLRATPIRG